VVYSSVCWSRSWALHKWLNRLRCHLGADLCGPRNYVYCRGKGWTNPFPIVRGDKTAMQSFIKFLWPLVLGLFLYVLTRLPATRFRADMHSFCFVSKSFWFRLTHPGPALDNWAHYAATSDFSTNSLRCWSCFKPTVHCNKSRDLIDVLEKFCLRHKLRPVL